MVKTKTKKSANYIKWDINENEISLNKYFTSIVVE